MVQFFPDIAEDPKVLTKVLLNISLHPQKIDTIMPILRYWTKHIARLRGDLISLMSRLSVALRKSCSKHPMVWNWNSNQIQP